MMALPSVNQSSVAVSSATITGLSSGKSSSPGPSRMPLASAARRDSSGMAWNICTGLDRKCWPTISEASPLALATRTCSIRFCELRTEIGALPPLGVHEETELHRLFPPAVFTLTSLARPAHPAV